ncbi:MAG: hypothetical protein LWW86_16275 [Micrococcales bacterium]|nr:hypothetical protein [Micrococcales bacterium]
MGCPGGLRAPGEILLSTWKYPVATLISRILGTLLVLAGVALVIPGAWLWSHIGSDGVATFATDPKAATVVLRPDTINRVDRPIEVRASGPGEIWLAKGDPSDASAALGDGKRVVPTGVDVRDWVLTTRTEGKSDAKVATAELWTEQATRDREITTTVDQAEAPQTIVISSTDGKPLTGLSYTLRDADWFRWALWPVIAGAALILAGLGLWLWTLLRGRKARRAEAATVVPAEEALPSDEVHADEVESTEGAEDVAVLDDEAVVEGEAPVDEAETGGAHGAYPLEEPAEQTQVIEDEPAEAPEQTRVIEEQTPEQTEVIVTDHDRSDEGGQR